MLDIVVGNAFAFAAEKHRLQARRHRAPPGPPYISHPVAVMGILLRCGPPFDDPQVLAAALLHDVVEDTDCTLLEIKATFGPRIASIVDALTRRVGESRRVHLARCAHNPRALMVKVADRAHNLLEAPLDPRWPTTREGYCEEAERILKACPTEGREPDPLVQELRRAITFARSC